MWNAYLVLLCVFAPAVLGGVSRPINPPGFKVRHQIGDEFGYIELPKTEDEAVSMGWIQYSRPPGPSQYRGLKMMCRPDDVAICVLLDKSTHVAGLQAAIDQRYHSNSVYDMEAGGYVNWTVTVRGVVTNNWATTVYFVSSDSVVIHHRDPTKFLQEPFVYVSGFKGALIRISIIADNNPMFTRQNCVVGVGRHYAYNMTSTLTCTSETMLPWVFFTKDNDFGGVGMFASGEINLPKGHWKWMESWSGENVAAALIDRPDCFFDIGNTVGYVGLKIIVLDNPEEILC